MRYRGLLISDNLVLESRQLPQLPTLLLGRLILRSYVLRIDIENVIVTGGSPGSCGTTKITFNPSDLRCLLMIPREKKYRTISSLIDHSCKTPGIAGTYPDMYVYLK
jgi:hypothetical protein